MQSIEKQQSSQWIWSLTTVHPLRNEVEQFIQGGYWRYFNASEISFLPELTSLWVNGQLKAAAGYCYAAQRTLFLEHYLNKPIESLLALRWQQDIVREDILEIGNLFASFSGGLRTLVIFFLRLCQAQQTPYVVFTATKQLAGSFQRLGVPLYALGKASAAALGDQQQHWGRYYEHQPQVVALRVSDVAVVLPKLQQGLRFAQDVEIL